MPHPTTSRRSAVALADLLPTAAGSAESSDDVDEARLGEAWPGEELSPGASDGRRRESATARHLARRALATLGHGPVAISRDRRGAPLWPRGIVGSMTHCEGFRGAAVAERSRLLALGIDAEPHAPLPPGLHDLVASPEEIAMLASLDARHPRVHWDRLLFSAKESLYKAWYPLTGRWLEFSEVRVTLRADGTFDVRLLVDDVPPAFGATDGLQGRWGVRATVLLSASWMLTDGVFPPSRTRPTRR